MALQLKPTPRLRYRFKTEPFAHQKRALNKLLKLDGSGGLFMEMGTGKTKVAIDWVGIGFYNSEVRRVLVIAPLSVLPVWPRQIRQHSQAGSRIFRLDGKVADSIRLLRLLVRENRRGDSPSDRVSWVILNYERIWRKQGTNSVEELLRAWKPDVVIYDESHRLKNQASKQSRSAARISQDIPQKLLLTGTAITKAPMDLFGQFRAMRPEVFGTNWWAFKYTYGVWGGFGRYQLRGYRNVQDLSRKVQQYSFRVKKKDCLDLPEKLFVDVPVTLSDRAMKIYRDMAEQMIVEIEETHATAAIVLVKLLRLSQITSGFIKDIEGNVRVFDDGKLLTCMDLVEDMVAEDHKIVIFVRFIQDIQRLAEKLTAAKIQFRILSGSVPGNRRDSIVQEFQNDPEVKVFVAQIQTGSLGIELTAADVAIYYSMNYNAADYWQSQDRLHRHGQTKNVTYYNLIVPRTIDQIVFQVLALKGKIAEAVLHNPRVLLG